MKTRIIVAAIAIPILILVIFFAPLWVFAILVGAISMGAAYELLRCVSPNAPKRFSAYAMVSALAIPILSIVVDVSILIYTILFALTVLMFTEYMLSYRRAAPMKLEQVLKVIFAGSVMPLLLSALVRVGDRDCSATYLLLPFVAAFSCDSGAYFAGKFFGKKKVFPHLSPNKTLEGCIGGTLSAIVLMLLYGLVLMLCGLRVNYFYLAIYGLGGSVACQLGDLAFSAVKREYGIKDYGKLIPGHGGMLDRFDSMHFTAPMVELLVILMPAIASA